MPWPRQIRRRIHSAVATQGTHDWRRFITPEELAEALARYGVSVEEQVGVGFNPSSAAFPSLLISAEARPDRFHHQPERAGLAVGDEQPKSPDAPWIEGGGFDRAAAKGRLKIRHR